MFPYHKNGLLYRRLRKHILSMLIEYNGDIAMTAQVLGAGERTLRRYIKEYKQEETNVSTDSSSSADDRTVPRLSV